MLDYIEVAVSVWYGYSLTKIISEDGNWYVLTSSKGQAKKEIKKSKKETHKKCKTLTKPAKASALNTDRNQYILFSHSVYGNGLRREHVSLSKQGQLEFNVLKYPYQSLWPPLLPLRMFSAQHNETKITASLWPWIRFIRSKVNKAEQI